MSKLTELPEKCISAFSTEYKVCLMPIGSCKQCTLLDDTGEQYAGIHPDIDDCLASSPVDAADLEGDGLGSEVKGGEITAEDVLKDYMGKGSYTWNAALQAMESYATAKVEAQCKALIKYLRVDGLYYEKSIDETYEDFKRIN